MTIETKKPTEMKNLLSLLTAMTLMQATNGLAAEPASSKNDFAFESRDGAVAISCGGQRVADYVYRDEKIPRP